MKIGIDISQLAFPDTGVANYLENLVSSLLDVDKENEYILFFSSLRKTVPKFALEMADKNERIEIKKFRYPPTMLDVFWNKLHIMPIEELIGPIDVFISSDWTQPPTRRAKMITVLYDLIIYKYPEETHNQTRFRFKNMNISPNIVSSQRRKLKWIKKECDAIICISESVKQDAIDILGIDESKLRVIYPGI